MSALQDVAETARLGVEDRVSLDLQVVRSDHTVGDWEELAPEIHRQRIVIEGWCPKAITDAEIRRYLADLAVVLDMCALTVPVTHRSEKFGWAGWTHWETSGAHFYAWEQPRLFFSVDIYTCKPFDNRDAVTFTRRFFNAPRIVWRGF